MARYSEISDADIVGIVKDLHEKNGRCPSVEDVRKIAKCGNIRIMPILKQWKQEHPDVQTSGPEGSLSTELPDEVRTLGESVIKSIWQAALDKAAERVRSELEHNRREHEKALAEIERLEIEVQTLVESTKAEIAEERRKTEAILHELGEAKGRIEELSKHLATSEAARQAGTDRESSLQAALTAEQDRYHALALSLSQRPTPETPDSTQNAAPTEKKKTRRNTKSEK